MAGTGTSGSGTSSSSTGTKSSSGTFDPAAMAGAGNPYANMVTNTNTTSTTQTSPQDITSLINIAMQQLVGRNATAQEIQTYGNELLAAEKQNFGKFSETATYGPTGKKAQITGTQVSSGIDPEAFLQSLISGSADAQSYKIATGYFQGMQEVLQNMKGTYNG